MSERGVCHRPEYWRGEGREMLEGYRDWVDFYMLKDLVVPQEADFDHMFRVDVVEKGKGLRKENFDTMHPVFHRPEPGFC